MIGTISKSCVWVLFFDEAIPPQTLEEILYVVLSKVAADAEFSKDFFDDFWCSGTVFEKLEDSRSDEVEVEHLALPDIQYDGSVLAVRATNACCNSVHLKLHSVGLRDEV
jgi:hypothetical protein